MAELKFSSVSQPRNIVGEWAVRLGVGLVFIAFGSEKFTSDPHWVQLFQQIGLGDWFRYFTGVVEIAGGLLVLIPRMLMAGLTVLALTMLGAVLIVAFVIGHPAESIFPGVFLAGLVGFLIWSRRA